MGKLKSSAPLWALGAMSGTSMDGIDAALVRTDGRDILAFGRTAYAAYTPQERAALRGAQGAWSSPEISALVTTRHGRLLAGFAADLVGFHGHTLAHEPGGRGTYQAGDGGALAETLGLPVVWDLRSADVGLGGQGAPLAPFFHHALARWARLGVPVAFVNIGGVANLTYVQPELADPCDPRALLAFDTGPGNAILDDLLAPRGVPFDAGGALAAEGIVDEVRLQEVQQQDYFAHPPPKSLDRNAFAEVAKELGALSLPDALATASAFTAATIAQGLRWCPTPVERVLVCGGGRKNATVMAMLADRIAALVEPVEAIDLDGDYLEAQAMAYLAVRVVRGMATSAPTTTGVPTPIGGGQIAYPSAAPSAELQP